MGDREVPYDPALVCDNCFHVGAFDFMGDYFCGDCLESDENDEVYVRNLTPEEIKVDYFAQRAIRVAMKYLMEDSGFRSFIKESDGG
jgi:hypothetical protein